MERERAPHHEGDDGDSAQGPHGGPAQLRTSPVHDDCGREASAGSAIQPNPLRALNFLVRHGVFGKDSNHMERAFLLAALLCIYLWA